jgi:hypothetical protein
MARMAVLALVLGACAMTACDDRPVVNDSEQVKTVSRGGQHGARIPSVGCSAAITSRVDPRWRKRSAVVGRFGLYGDAADIRTAEPWGRSAFWTKIPVIVDGRRPVTLRVTSEDRHRVGLTYTESASSPATSRDGRRGLATAPRATRFKPCRDRSPTAWPGGLVLASRSTVRFEVRLEGKRWRRVTISGR